MRKFWLKFRHLLVSLGILSFWAIIALGLVFLFDQTLLKKLSEDFRQTKLLETGAKTDLATLKTKDSILSLREKNLDHLTQIQDHVSTASILTQLQKTANFCGLQVIAANTSGDTKEASPWTEQHFTTKVKGNLEGIHCLVSALEGGIPLFQTEQIHVISQNGFHYADIEVKTWMK